MENYNPFGAPEDFNPKNDYMQEDCWDFGTKALAADIGLINSSPSPTTLKIRKQKPK